MNQLNGLILIDKNNGSTSHDIVGQLRKILNMRAIGHAGTLDPMATGLLICLVGEATKLSQYVMAEDKSYRVGIKFGVVTDTGDITGRVLREADASLVSNLNLEQISAEAQKLVGLIKLTVPKYSAIKIAGKKLYEYAREDEEVVVPEREMVIRSITQLKYSDGRAEFEMDCGKGTYVRSWVEKLGVVLGVGATVESLRRLSSGPFHLDEAVTVDGLKNLVKEGDLAQGLSEKFVPMKDVLKGWPSVKLHGRDPLLVSNGQIPHGILAQLRVSDFGGGVRLLNETGGLLALMVKDQEKGVRLARVFKP
jgi:tRNA pseudouridine55 synthase